VEIGEETDKIGFEMGDRLPVANNFEVKDDFMHEVQEKYASQTGGSKWHHAEHYAGEWWNSAMQPLEDDDRRIVHDEHTAGVKAALNEREAQLRQAIGQINEAEKQLKEEKERFDKLQQSLTALHQMSMQQMQTIGMNNATITKSNDEVKELMTTVADLRLQMATGGGAAVAPPTENFSLQMRMRHFTGETQQGKRVPAFDLWYVEFKANVKTMPQQRQLALLINHLEGAAKLALIAMDEETQNDYAKLVEALKTRYPPEYTPREALTAFNARKQGAKETVDQYSNELRMLLDIAVNTYEEGVRVSVYTSTLRTRLLEGISPRILYKMNVKEMEEMSPEQIVNDARENERQLTRGQTETQDARTQGSQEFYGGWHGNNTYYNSQQNSQRPQHGSGPPIRGSYQRGGQQSQAHNHMCTFCKIVGHNWQECRKRLKKEAGGQQVTQGPSHNARGTQDEPTPQADTGKEYKASMANYATQAKNYDKYASDQSSNGKTARRKKNKKRRTTNLYGNVGKALSEPTLEAACPVLERTMYVEGCHTVGVPFDSGAAMNVISEARLRGITAKARMPQSEYDRRKCPPPVAVMKVVEGGKFDVAYGFRLAVRFPHGDNCQILFCVIASDSTELLLGMPALRALNCAFIFPDRLDTNALQVEPWVEKNQIASRTQNAPIGAASGK